MSGRAFNVGDRVRSVASGTEYVVTKRWRDPGMRSYEYEVERDGEGGARYVNAFRRHEIEAVR